MTWKLAGAAAMAMAVAACGGNRMDNSRAMSAPVVAQPAPVVAADATQPTAAPVATTPTERTTSARSTRRARVAATRSGGRTVGAVYNPAAAGPGAGGMGGQTGTVGTMGTGTPSTGPGGTTNVGSGNQPGTGGSSSSR